MPENEKAVLEEALDNLREAGQRIRAGMTDVFSTTFRGDIATIHISLV